MYPYLFVFFLLTLFCFLDFFKEFAKNRIFFYYLCTFILIVFSGFRVEGIGSDDHNYVEIYRTIPSIQELLSFNFKLSEYRKEVGYLSLNIILKSISNNYSLLFFSVAFFSVGLASINYRKYSNFCFLSLILFFVHPYLYRDMNQIRVAVALGICLFSIPHLEERNLKNFSITILVAMCFHLVSLAMIIPYVLSYFKIGRKKGLIMVLISFLLGSLSISTYLLSLAPSIKLSITSSLINYSNSEMYSADLGFFNITNIKSMFIFSVLTIFYNRLYSSQIYFKTMYMMYALSLAWRLAFSDFAILAGRVGTVFEIVEVILIPSFVLLFKNKIFGCGVIILYAFLILFMNLYYVERRNYNWILSLVDNFNLAGIV